jgi:site-specific DNA-methyltransferase (adenine-specific)
MISETFNIDCIEGMKQYPDKYFDLAVVDPPYGLGIDGQKLNNNNKNPKHNRKAHDFKGWDNAIPNEEYFKELFRVSKNQIIWGGNYFTEYLKPTKAWIFWYKGQNDLTMSDGEMAWTSFSKVTRQVTINRAELIKQNTFHPTEKPIKLYKWILSNYAEEGMKILDTHLGSGSSRIAAYKAKLDFIGFELDKEYFEQGNQRFEEFKIQFEQEIGTEKILKNQHRLF